MNAPSVGIAVVHFGEADATRRCLASIRRDPSEVARQVVVVDNSGDFPGELLRPGEEILDSRDNPGFGEGANRGLRYLLKRASPPRLLVLNHDVELDPGFLEGVVRALEVPATGSRAVEDAVGAAAGPIYSVTPEGEAPQLWYAGGEVRALTGTVRQSRSATDAQRRRQVGFLPGTALALSADAFEASGGFDPRFFLYNEDLDLCRRLVAGGFALRFEPAMSCRHRLGAATGSEDRSPLYLEHLTAGRLLPFESRAYRLYLGAVHTPYVLLRCLAAVVSHGGDAGPRVRALLRGHLRALSSVWSG